MYLNHGGGSRTAGWFHGGSQRRIHSGSHSGTHGGVPGSAGGNTKRGAREKQACSGAVGRVHFAKGSRSQPRAGDKS